MNKIFEWKRIKTKSDTTLVYFLLLIVQMLIDFLSVNYFDTNCVNSDLFGKWILIHLNIMNLK